MTIPLGDFKLEIECSSCEGLGYSDGPHPWICPLCKGRGLIINTIMNINYKSKLSRPLNIQLYNARARAYSMIQVKTFEFKVFFTIALFFYPAAISLALISGYYLLSLILAAIFSGYGLYLFLELNEWSRIYKIHFKNYE